MKYAAAPCSMLCINGFILVAQITELSLHNASYGVVTAFIFIEPMK